MLVLSDKTNSVQKLNLPTSNIKNKNNKYNDNGTNGKPNPDDIVLYLYTTYDSNSFDLISIISYSITLVHPRQFYNDYDNEIAALVKLQILEAGQIF